MMARRAREAVPYSVVIPTTGRESLGALLTALATSADPALDEVVVVDDRAVPTPELTLPWTTMATRVVRSGGRGPAAARNAGWRAASTEWVVFLDDDVLPGPEWAHELQRDLDRLADDVAGCQGKIVVPLPQDRAPTDLERATAGLAGAWWITADMAYRRSILAAVGGFDEEFPRAYREDADLAMRVQAKGHRLEHGGRRTEHPVRPAGFFASVRAQAGNADNARMRHKHGRKWRRRIGEGPGRTRQHLLTTAAAGVTLVAAGLPRRPMWTVTALAGASLWLALTTEFALRRIAAGPRTPAEIARMTVTSLAIPPTACWHRLLGEIRSARGRKLAPAAVLFDRDDTLIHDVPYNGNPRDVRPIAGVREALDRLRKRGVRIGIVSNQSGVGRGMIATHQVEAVNAEVERQLGPFQTWQICEHAEGDGCDCRKPEPGLIEQAASVLDATPESCVVIGDTGADIEAALAAGARAILVPTERTLPDEIRQAWLDAEVARTVGHAVQRVLAGVR